jgi:2',3'-cyclic-nucleotide 2'-phosphodiesterase (5'-nucleotidase family)
VSRIKPLFLSGALLLSLVAFGAQSAHAQAVAPAPSPKPADIRARITEIQVDPGVPDDPEVEKMLQTYAPRVRALNEVIGTLKGELKKGGIGAGSLGNFVADALRDRAQVKTGKPVLLAITNSGGLRKSAIAEGDLRAGDIFELLPFENALVTVDLTGEQLRRFLDVILKNRDAQSGARITYRTNEKKENEIVSVKLGSSGNELEIDPKATYTITTIDYLVKRGGDYTILQEGKNLQPLGLTMRDAVLDYVKSETAAGRPIKSTLDGRFRSDKPQSETEKPE